MEWISVKNRLPDEDTNCIVFIKDLGSVVVCKFYEDFTLIRNGWYSGNFEHGVTHWMPLPDPPK